MDIETYRNKAYKLEEQGDRYATGDYQRSIAYYRQALDLYIELYPHDHDPDTLYNAARLCLQLSEKTNQPLKLEYIDQAIQFSCTVLQIRPECLDTLFNLAQAYLSKAQMMTDQANAMSQNYLQQCANTLLKLITLQRIQLEQMNRPSNDPPPSASSERNIYIDHEDENMEILVTESIDVTPTSIIDSILLLVECHAMQVSLCTTVHDMQVHERTVCELLDQAKQLASTIPPPSPVPQSTYMIDLTHSDMQSVHLDCLLSESYYYRAHAIQYATLTNDPIAIDTHFQLVISPLKNVIELCNPKVHVRANCDAGDTYVDWYESLTSYTDANRHVWELMALTSKHYATALTKAPTSVSILFHLAETEWNRALWTRRIANLDAGVQHTLYKNTVIYARRGYELLLKNEPGSDLNDQFFNLLVQAYEVLGLTEDLRVLRASSGHI